MENKLFNIEIKPVKNNSNLFKLAKPIELLSPFMRVTFPLEKSYGNLHLKLEFTKFKENNKMLKFFKLIYSIEKNYCTKLLYCLDDDCSIKSQLKQYGNYDPFIVLKIPQDRKKKYITANIKNSTKRTFYDVNVKEFVQVLIYADVLYVDSKKGITFKWKIKELSFQNPDTDSEDED